MRLHQLYRSTWLPIPVQTAFDFFCDPFNLQKITPPELDFCVTEPPSGSMGQNVEIGYQLKLWKIPFRWRSRIMDWRTGRSFTDVAIKSPYRVWHHQHFLTPEQEGTRMIDLVNYALPLWPIGELGHPIVRYQLKRIFDYRESSFQAILGQRGTDSIRDARNAHQAA